MAIYFLKGEQNLSENQPLATTPKKPGQIPRWILLIAGIIAILLATAIEAVGIMRPWEIRLPELLGLPSSVQERIVFLSLPDGTEKGNDTMDVALVLRGLSMLHPSLILLATEHRPSGESVQLLQGVKDQLQAKGIPLTEAAPPSTESLWRPIPLCRYFPPEFAERKESLPLVAGSAPTEGTFRVLGLSSQDPGILPLLSVTASGEIAGSLWWEGLMRGQPNAPVWLLDDHLLVFPNHAALPLVMGGLSVPPDLALPHSITSDDFLLKMEERERGSLSPDFDSLWDHAIVVVGPSSLRSMTSALVSLRKMTALGAVTLTTQAGIMVILIVILLMVFALSPRESYLLTGLVLIFGCLGCWWCLRQGILPPLLAWVVALIVSLVMGILTKQRPSVR